MFKKIIVAAALLGIVSPLLAGAVTVGPIRVEYKADPGDVIKGEMYIKNEGADTATFYPSFQRFTETDGEKKFTQEVSDLSTWFKLPASVTLKGGEDQRVPFTIEVPKDAAPGGHFAVAWWSTSPPAAGAEQVSIVTRAGILVYLTVSGDIHEEGSVASFTTQSGGHVFAGPPVAFVIQFRNSGNVSLKPAGELRLRNMWGVVKATVPANKDGVIILPASTKNILLTAPGGSFFGLYRAELVLKYGDSGQEARSNLTLFFFPPLETAMAVIVLLVLLSLPWIIRRYNAWIIARSRQS